MRCGRCFEAVGRDGGWAERMTTSQLLADGWMAGDGKRASGSKQRRPSARACALRSIEDGHRCGRVTGWVGARRATRAIRCSAVSGAAKEDPACAAIS